MKTPAVLFIILIVLSASAAPVAAADCGAAEALYKKAVELGLTDIDRRIELLEKASRQCQDVHIEYQLGRSREAAGNLESARNHYLSAVGLTDTPKMRARIFFRLGLVNEGLNNPPTALAYFQESEKYHPFSKTREKIADLLEVRYTKGMPPEKIEEALLANRNFRFSPDPHVDIYINFKLDRDDLTENGRRQADWLGEALTKPVFSKSAFNIVGHTCSKGTFKHNLDLSERRADTVYTYLHNRFSIPYRRLKKEGRGETELLFKEERSKREFELNRRVEVEIQ